VNSGEKESVYFTIGKPEGKRPLGRPRHKLVDNIKMDLVDLRLSGLDWIGVAQNRYSWRALVNSAKNLLLPKNSEELLSCYTTGGLSSSAYSHRIS
jgi:hypothetical protein